MVMVTEMGDMELVLVLEVEEGDMEIVEASAKKIGKWQTIGHLFQLCDGSGWLNECFLFLWIYSEVCHNIV